MILTDQQAHDLLSAGLISDDLVLAAETDRGVDERLVQIWTDYCGDPERELSDEEAARFGARLTSHLRWIDAWYEDLAEASAPW